MWKHEIRRTKSALVWGIGCLAALALAGVAAAQDSLDEAPAGVVDSGDTAWMLASCALVLFMTPGLALFYGGMDRRKNVLGTMLHSFVAMGLASVLWVIVGYSIAFGDGGPYFGNLDYVGLNGVGMAPGPYSETIPHVAFCAFQMMFAIITPALITGAFAGRMKFSAYVAFFTAWLLLVYCPIAHWVWGAGGWLGGSGVGALDFAGGTVVHISSGVSALVACLLIGKRAGYPSEEMRPHNLTLTLIGTGILWFGWFGFNAGSALKADGGAANALMTTNTAAATAMLVWMLIEWLHHGKPTALGGATGVVAGLVGITPAAGFVDPGSSIAIGALAALCCYVAVALKNKLGYDDSLDTFGVHGVGGAVGAILTGVFAATAIGGTAGLLEGDAGQVVKQFIGVGATVVYAAVASAILLLLVKAIFGLRVAPNEEEIGLDVSQHGEEGYVL